jgi:hypothetical protein
MIHLDTSQLSHYLDDVERVAVVRPPVAHAG